MTTLNAGSSAVLSLAIGDTFLITKTAANEGTFSVVNSSGVVRDRGQFGNVPMTNKVYGPYVDATTLTLTCTIGSIDYTKVTSGGGGGGGSTTINVIPKTSNYTIMSGDTAACFSNTGAAGTVILALPAATVGANYSAYVAAAQILEFLAQGTDVIASGLTNSAAAGNVQSNLVGNYIQLSVLTPGKWVINNIVGDWTLT